MKKLDDLHLTQLQKIAKTLIKQGISVIPIHGNNDRTNPKKPSVRWGKYQKKLATSYEIESWFRQKITAIGIICGQISNLTVIDFDDYLTYQTFRKANPNYANTFTVKTRRGYHLYYQTNQRIQTHKFVGGDIKGEKSYVVAPPSIINGHQYYAINDAEPIKLSPDDVDNIFNFLQINQALQPLISYETYIASNPKLIEQYSHLSDEIGRNNALYRVASVAKSYGVPQNRVEQELIPYHIIQPSSPDHKPESSENRLSEAKRTIQSAYSSTKYTSYSTKGIPNSIREALLKNQKSTVMSRLLDIFHLAKWKPHFKFTMPEAIALCQPFGMNRKSVMKALTGCLSTVNDESIIIRKNVVYPDSRGLKSHERGRRIQTMFEVPSTDDLLRLLDVTPTPSDKIVTGDVKNAHLYRLALHREYIKRMSPQVPMRWLADRLGVNVRTIQRYNRELDVQITQNLGCFTLSKSNLDSLPKRHRNVEKNSTNGFWLETKDGSRYPAWKHVGSTLLKTSPDAPVLVCVQQASTLRINTQVSEDRATEYLPITPSQFIKIQAFRTYTDSQPSLKQAVNNLFAHVKKRVKRMRYFKFQLHFDSVINWIAKDDVAETITSYLFAFDADGNEVHRPAKRGIAYRMLKEFGNGNVYLALLDIETEAFYTLARYSAKYGYLSSAMNYLLRALD